MPNPERHPVEIPAARVSARKREIADIVQHVAARDLRLDPEALPIRWFMTVEGTEEADASPLEEVFARFGRHVAGVYTPGTIWLRATSRARRLAYTTAHETRHHYQAVHASWLSP